MWHAGRTVGRTIYKGDGPDDLIGVMDTRELAAEVVKRWNSYGSLVGACEKAYGYLTHGSTLDPNEEKEVLDTLRAAINKARGE